ncbi:hypothetical protein HDF26_001749 [Pedobacter cryoconitis]|uniref:DUF6850 domain-containing protein n=1 Tax=Pedobacter cryoconitis TaxID=188932 RepID=A0A7W9DZF5_9SPHI|nr:DUF6850 family outer membrane beta-barrel protein [Pedobacter cryoconitis]MBB5636921.1 hypothetical protein [Pedobacter cryoconitis]MBB6271322.1 hypothetical protein [Pedobacter cryoconitis]
MIRLYIISLCFIIGTGTACANDTTRISRIDTTGLRERIRINNAPVSLFTDVFYNSPALKYFARNNSLTQLSLGFNQYKQDLYQVQKGSGQKVFGFEADAYQKNKKDVVWGNASYQNGKRYQVNWNESSDLQLIYPYVMADTVGGDLSYEEYAFSGGYALKLNQTTLGITGKYRALIEYRNIDPRPKNVTSDLEISIGVSHPVNRAYEIALGLSARKYTQDNQLKFFSELGGPVVYHMVGMGVANQLLTGNKLNAFYDGSGSGIQVQLIPMNKNGFFSSFAYNRFSFEKVIRDLQALPVSDLTATTIKGEFAYLKNNGQNHYGIKASILKEQRIGVESRFDNRGPDNYVKISSDKRYRNDRSDLNLAFIYGQQKNKDLSWTVNANLGLLSNETQYIEPTRSMEFSAIHTTIDAQFSLPAGQSLIQAGAGFTLLRNTKGTKSWPDLVSASAAQQMLLTNFAYLTSNYNQLNLFLRWDRPMIKGMGVFLKSNWEHTTFDSFHKGNQCILSAGITF